MKPDFDKGGGLVPAVAQDATTGEVLMLAYMDEEAYDATRRTGFMHYHSRSRGKLWRKGEESGNVQRVVSLRLDCDGDAVLAVVDQEGPACHTGARTCFAAAPPISGSALHGLLELARVLRARKEAPPVGSWTAKLLADDNLRLKKVVEEAGEVVMAAKDGDPDALARELADLLYHGLVAGVAAGVDPEDVLKVLRARRAEEDSDPPTDASSN